MSTRALLTGRAVRIGGTTLSASAIDANLARIAIVIEAALDTLAIAFNLPSPTETGIGAADTTCWTGVAGTRTATLVSATVGVNLAAFIVLTGSAAADLVCIAVEIVFAENGCAGLNAISVGITNLAARAVRVATAIAVDALTTTADLIAPAPVVVFAGCGGTRSVRTNLGSRTIGIGGTLPGDWPSVSPSITDPGQTKRAADHAPSDGGQDASP